MAQENIASENMLIFKMLEQLAPIIPAPLFWVDKHSKIIGINNQALQAIGAKTINDVLGKAAYEFYPPSLGKKIVEHNEEVMRAKKILTQEESIEDISTGKIKYFTSIKAPLYDEAGDVVGVIGTLSDITELKENKQELANYAQIIQNLPASVYWKDKEGRYLGCNKYVMDMAGIEKSEQIVGKTDYELSWKEVAHELKAMDDEVLNYGRREHEEPLYLADGRKRLFLTVKTPLHDLNGEVQGTMGVSLDITERKQQEEKLVIYGQIIESLPGFVHWKDVNSNYMGGNKNLADLLSLKSSEEISGLSEHKTPWALKNNQAAIHNINADQYVVKTGKTIITEENLGIKNSNEKEIFVRTEKSPLLNKEGQVIGVLGISVDITERKEQEEKLGIYAQVIENLPGYIYWKNKDSVYIGCNKNLAKLSNLSSITDVIGKSDHAFSWGKYADKFAQDDQFVMSTGKNFVTEDYLSINSASGSPMIVRTEKKPLTNSNGDIIGVLGVAVDITERKEQEEKLVIYAQIIQNLPCHVFWKDLNGVYLGGSKAQIDIFNNNFIGKTISELLDQKSASVIMKHDEEVLKTGQAIEFEEELVVKNKRIFFLSHKSPLMDSNGVAIGMLGVSFDITERKKYEEKLAIYAQVMESLPGYVYWKDLNSVFMGGNQNTAILAGFKNHNDLAGKTDYEMGWGIKDSKIADKYVQDDQYVIQNKKSLVIEGIVYGVENGKRTFLTVRTEKTPLLDEQGNVIGVLGVAVDMTARKLLEEKQNEFAKTVLQVVHDIRSPLTVIDMLTSEISHLPEEQRVSLRHAVRRINDIAHNLIDTYKGRNLADSSDAQKIPIAVFIDRIISEKRFQFAKKGIEFQVSIAPNAYFAFALFEAPELQRILSNLINNAVEASAENAIIEINLSIDKNDELVLNIKDHGVGMPEEMIKKVGEYGLSHGKEKGAGLGLAHAKEWMEKHKGRLQLISKINEGTSVSLCFALCEPPVWFAQELNLTKDSIVLIIDDDPSIHFLWTQRFNVLKEKIPGMKVFHFHYVKDLVQWFIGNKVAAKHLILLSDNELIGSELSGQQLLEKYANNVGQAFLVTSHYAFYDLAENLIKIKARLLPKELVMHLPINISKAKAKQDNFDNKKIEFVLLDDNKILTQAYKFLAKSKNRNILLFNNPDDLLEALEHIPKDTVFYIDSQLEEIKGEDFAKTLFDRGYKELYLATGVVDANFNIANHPWLKGVTGKPEL